MKCKMCGGKCVKKQIGQDVVHICQYCGMEYVEEKQMEQPVITPTSTPAPAPVDKNPGKLSGEELYDKVIGSVVEIYCGDGAGTRSGGSGFIVSQKGFVLTNAHVVLDRMGNVFPSIAVFKDGKTCPAYPIAVGKPVSRQTPDGVDLCLLYVDDDICLHNACRFGDVSKLRNGQTVYLIGNSLGRGTCITAGIISDKERKHYKAAHPYIMADIASNPGNSGGPLFNDQGEVIGVHVSSDVDEHIGIAAQGMKNSIPADVAEACLRMVANHQSLRTVDLGELNRYKEGTDCQVSIGTIFTGIKLLMDIIEFIVSLIKKKKG